LHCIRPGRRQIRIGKTINAVDDRYSIARGIVVRLQDIMSPASTSTINLPGYY